MKEPITVQVLYDRNGGKPQVAGFIWDDRSYKVDKVELVNRLEKGRDLVYLFSVATKDGAYLLRFEPATLRWWLEEVYWAC